MVFFIFLDCTVCSLHAYIYDPTMMLLIGIWMSLTKNPIKPIMQKPMAVAIAIFWNSRRSGFVQRFTNRNESLANRRAGSQNLTTWSIFYLFCFCMICWTELQNDKEKFAQLFNDTIDDDWFCCSCLEREREKVVRVELLHQQSELSTNTNSHHLNLTGYFSRQTFMLIEITQKGSELSHINNLFLNIFLFKFVLKTTYVNWYISDWTDTARKKLPSVPSP